MPERADTGAMPMTQPHEAPIFDTGPHPTPMTPRAGSEQRNPWFDPQPSHVEPVVDIFAPTDVLVAEREPQPSVPAQPVAVPSQYQYLKVWKLITVLCGVWLVAGAVGLGLYYWWFRAPDKTWVEVSVLMYVMASVVGALLVSLPDQRPGLSATSLAVITAPFASGLAAGALYAAFAFG